MPITKQIKSAKQNLKAATVRDFTGAWNILDDDLNLATKYSTKLFNCAVLADGTVTVRYGTRLFANLNPAMSSPGARVVNIEYYGAAIIAVLSNGDVLSVLGDGTVNRIWDSTIAGALPGDPDGWGPTDFASFAQFNGELIICNGVDKPLIVFGDLTVDYLQDLGTNSNLNTPICKYVTVCDRFLVMAGDPLHPNRIHISSRDTSGTFYGDPDPNDGTFVDVGSIITNASFIRGIASFRGKLIVGYAEGTILATLGQYNEDGSEHIPAFDDPVDQYGTISHRSMISYGDDMLMMDLVGVPSLKRTVFSGTIRPERVSDLIDSEMSQMLENLSFGSLENRVFSVYNQREGQFLFFVPDTDSYETTTQTKAYSFIYRPSLNLAGWARYDGWNFSCGCRTVQGSVVFGDKNGKLWLYGSDTDPVYADFKNDSTINSGNGLPITFAWEFPWSDINKRMKTKTTKYIGLDTRGTAEFLAKMYVDRYMINELLADAPLLSMEFSGGDSGGFGLGYPSFGGGRNTSNELLYAWPAKFQIMKLAFAGSVTEPLKFVSVSLLYQDGGFFR